VALVGRRRRCAAGGGVHPPRRTAETGSRGRPRQSHGGAERGESRWATRIPRQARLTGREGHPRPHSRGAVGRTASQRGHAPRPADQADPPAPGRARLPAAVGAGWRPPSRPWPPEAAPQSCGSWRVWPARKGTWASGAALQQRPDELARGTGNRGRPPAMTLQGRVLGGRYALGAMVGAGGMGQVYRARDRVLERTVAVKVLTAASTDDLELVARFSREARAAAALNHPNIVAVFDSGADGDLHTWSRSTWRARAWPGCCAERACWAQGGSPRSDARCARGWRPRTPRGWSTATSRPATCWSIRRGWSRWPTSGSPSWPQRPP
jgi:Protein kinase domain